MVDWLEKIIFSIFQCWTIYSIRQGRHTRRNIFILHSFLFFNHLIAKHIRHILASNGKNISIINQFTLINPNSSLTQGSNRSNIVAYE